MCFAAAIPIALTAIAAAGTVYGGVQSANAQKSAANAISAQNLATSQAQQQAFNQRMAASNQQTDAQSAIIQQEAAARNQAATIMRNQQQAALNQTNSVLDTENQAAERLRGAGDTQAQTLLNATNAQTLAQAQTGQQAQAAQLLQQSQSGQQLGPQATDPNGGGASTTTTGDAATDAAIARRTAIAATNVRNYGSDIAKVASYGAPLQAIGQAVAANQVGIMPAQEAGRLLTAGAGTRMAPSLLAYNQAGATGQTADALAQAQAQGKMNYAGLQYGNLTEQANLGQSDADVAAKNVADQAKQDAAYKAQLAGLISGVGGLAGYGAGYLGGGPDGVFTKGFQSLKSAFA